MIREGQRFAKLGRCNSHRAAAPDFRNIQIPDYDGGEVSSDDEEWTGSGLFPVKGGSDEEVSSRRPRPEKPRHEAKPRHTSDDEKPLHRREKPVPAPAVPKPAAPKVASAPKPAETDEGNDTEPMADEELIASLATVVPKAQAEKAVAQRKAKPEQKAPTHAPAAAPAAPQQKVQPRVSLPKKKKQPRKAPVELGKGAPASRLGDFLQGVNVLLFEVPDDQKRVLGRYVMAYGGKLEDAVAEETTHVVTAKDWETAFQDAVETHAGLSIVRPQWLIECHKQQKLVETTAFTVAPNSS